MIVGIECTARTFGVGAVDKGKILANVRDMFITEKGGIIPALVSGLIFSPLFFERNFFPFFTGSKTITKKISKIKPENWYSGCFFLTN